MCSKIAATSASVSATLAANSSLRTKSHMPGPTPATRASAYGSRIRGFGLAVSPARAAATMTAVEPTLVAMSQVSLCVRNELIAPFYRKNLAKLYELWWTQQLIAQFPEFVGHQQLELVHNRG